MAAKQRYAIRRVEKEQRDCEKPDEESRSNNARAWRSETEQGNLDGDAFEATRRHIDYIAATKQCEDNAATTVSATESIRTRRSENQKAQRRLTREPQTQSCVWSNGEREHRHTKSSVPTMPERD